MKEENYTEEQIRAEVNSHLENVKLRRCCQCSNRNQTCTRCEELGIPISRYMYAGHCKFYKTDEQKMIEEAKAAIAMHDKETKKKDRSLTMSFASSGMSMVFLEDFLARIETEYNDALKRIEAKYKGKSERMDEDDEQYLKDKKKEYKRCKTYVESLISALKKMQFHLNEARKQYVHFVEPKLNKAFFNEDHTAFNGEEYDSHGEDVFEMCEVLQKYFDATYMNQENTIVIHNCIDSLPGERLWNKEDYKRYKFRR